VNADCNSRLGRGVAYCVVKLIQDVENEPINLIKGEKEKDGRGGGGPPVCASSRC